MARFSSVKIEKLLGIPANPLPNQFYLVESDTLTQLYLSDSKAQLYLLNSTSSDSLPDQAGHAGEILTTDGMVVSWIPVPAATTPIYGETPSGTINGLNAIFTSAHSPLVGSLRVYLNGQRLKGGNDYTFSGATITMSTLPFAGDILQIDYNY